MLGLSSPGDYVAVVVLIASATVGTLANTATNLSVEKDWVFTILGKNERVRA